MLDELPGRLVLGVGAHSQLCPDPAVIAELERRRVRVECLPTDAAVRRYGELDERTTLLCHKSHKRRLPTCPD